MCISRSVCFTEIALYLNDDAEEDSNLRRIQSFFSDYELNYVQIAIILISFIPSKKYRLCIDRTNWQFGNTDINIFALTIYYKDVGIPILFEMLEKRGNSNQEERIKLLERFIEIFGYKCIRSIVADREFIGEEWWKFLMKNNIKFQIRIPKSIYIEIDNDKKRGDDLLKAHGKCSFKNVKIKGLILHLAMDFSKNKKGESDPLLVITNDKNCDALEIYKERWSIEVFFQSLKGRGFNIEGTHLKDIKRVAKLFALTCLAFVICLTIGCYADACEKPIEIKNHGYKANSFFRHGLNILRKVFIRPRNSEKRLDELINLIVDFTNSVFYFITQKLLKIEVI